MKLERCVVCGAQVLEPTTGYIEGPRLCNWCRKEIPPPVLNATIRPGVYRLFVRTGHSWTFVKATLAGPFVCVFLEERSKPFYLRLTDIVWCSDETSLEEQNQ